MKRLILCALLATATLAELSAVHAAGTTEVFAENVDAGGTDLRTKVYIPTSGGPTWPAIVEFVGGQFKNGTNGPDNVCQDIANNGFVVFSCETRMSPPHPDMSTPHPPGDPQQDPPSTGRPPQGTDDALLGILYGRNPPASSVAFGKVNGKVAVVGGSSGGTKAAWWLINGTPGSSMPDAFVGCSGLYDLDDSNMLASSFGHVIEEYLGHTTDEGQTFHDAAKAASPYWSTPAATPKPALIINSTGETIKQSVADHFVTKLTDAGGTVQYVLRTGNEHAFTYWNLNCGDGCLFPTVEALVIDFLQEKLNLPEAPPVVAPNTSFLKQ